MFKVIIVVAVVYVVAAKLVNVIRDRSLTEKERFRRKERKQFARNLLFCTSEVRLDAYNKRVLSKDAKDALLERCLLIFKENGITIPTTVKGCSHHSAFATLYADISIGNHVRIHFNSQAEYFEFHVSLWGNNLLRERIWQLNGGGCDLIYDDYRKNENPSLDQFENDVIKEAERVVNAIKSFELNLLYVGCRVKEIQEQLNAINTSGNRRISDLQLKAKEGEVRIKAKLEDDIETIRRETAQNIDEVLNEALSLIA